METKHAISKHNVRGIFTRKGQKQYRHANKRWYPVVDTELVDYSTRFSEFGVCKARVGMEWIALPNDDIIVAYDGGETSRISVPAGTLVRRVSWGCPAMAGIVAVILPPEASQDNGRT